MRVGKGICSIAVNIGDAVLQSWEGLLHEAWTEKAGA